MNPEFEYMVVMERRRDELAAAENSRLVKQALNAERERTGLTVHVSLLSRIAQELVLLFGRGLYWFGERIQVWGCRLQYRFAMSEMRGEPAPCK
jgi:hypothetical protein